MFASFYAVKVIRKSFYFKMILQKEWDMTKMICAIIKKKIIHSLK